MVTFISQCEKKAHNRTRRVLDAFADRIGDNTWQTVITQEGLLAVKKLLRKTASKNTAVSCHWLRSRSRSELVWVVGNKNKFDAQGRVPVNFTAHALKAESALQVVGVISLFAGIAGLFHDVGKANQLFQKKLQENYSGKQYEPYRHEWVSLKIFQVFVGKLNDREWVKKLANIDNNAETEIVSALSPSSEWLKANPFTSLPAMAKIVAWLIVTHHRLPCSPESNKASIGHIQDWPKYFDAGWNAARSVEQHDEEALRENWAFLNENKTPLASVAWQIKARNQAKAILNSPAIWEQHDWFNQRFVAHLSRLSLMLADHYYSSAPSKSNPDWQDPNYHCYANAYPGRERQKLDDHNIGVGYNAARIARTLLNLKNELPGLTSDRAFTQSVPEKFRQKFGWQDKAYKKAGNLREDTTKFGFFGINMASTGAGKTRANARIMHALADERESRFSVALGLRTLTLQTGDAIKKDMAINEDEIAVLIGSQAVRELHNLRRQTEDKLTEYEKSGSESATPLVDDNLNIQHSLADYSGDCAKWLEHDPKILRLIQAPVLVSTIDYLIPATEGIRGGRQIAPMLRLLTSDLVLDEPDDFGLEDMPALCRLVNWAGMLGSRVLLSTASLPPALAYALFEAYRDGRKYYVDATNESPTQTSICCAWFDEQNKPFANLCVSTDEFKQAHQTFVQARAGQLVKHDLGLVEGRCEPHDAVEQKTPLEILSKTISSSIYKLHEKNYVEHEAGAKVSIGLVRMANINPLVAVAKNLYAWDAPEDYQVHYCVYHSQFPLVVRSAIEERLDKALDRHGQQIWWEQSGIQQKILASPIKNHIFVVLATAVAEVGRDHDYDWAVAEPSSMRSIIQLAGRVQRHRNKKPIAENMHILSKNYKGLCGVHPVHPAFCKPGFESETLAYCSTDLRDLLDEDAFQSISAIPRIQQPDKIRPMVDGKFSDFIGLEHIAHFKSLLSSSDNEDSAKIWWRYDVSWCAEVQLMQPFRKSWPEDVFCLTYSERMDTLKWQEVDTQVKPRNASNTNKIRHLSGDMVLGKGINAWFENDVLGLMENIENQLEKNKTNLWRNLTEVRLRKPKREEGAKWLNHPYLGIHEEVGDC